MSACIIIGASGVQAATPADWKVFQKNAAYNSTGIRFGFYANAGLTPDITNDFGQRPIIREGFYSWRLIEPDSSTGIDFTQSAYVNLTNKLKTIHRLGATPMTAVNIGFSAKYAGDGIKTSIPAHYTQDITNATTRAKAKTFARQFVQQLLNDVGEVILLVDYECNWNYDTRIVANRTVASEWFVECVNEMKSAANNIGKGNLLRIAVNFNGDQYSNASTWLGGANGNAHTPQTWVTDMVAAANLVSLDIYQFDPNNPTSATTFFNNIKFWTQKYCPSSKKFYIMEIGYSSIKTEDPNYTPPGGSGGAEKGHGTEADQSTFFNNLLGGLKSRNAPGGEWGNKLAGISIWMYHDQVIDQAGGADDYYGMVRFDNTNKPVFTTVRNKFTTLENDSQVRPSNHSSNGDVTAALHSSTDSSNVNLTYSDGVNHDYLTCTFTIPSNAGTVNLNTVTTTNGSLLIRFANSDKWIETSASNQSTYNLNITNHIVKGTSNTMHIRFTGPYLPVTRTVKKVLVTY